MNRRAVGLAALTLSALALRLPGIGAESVWVDEGWSMHMIRLPPDEFFRVTFEEDGHPPLYLVLLRLWSGLFPSIEGLRAFSALCTAGAVLFCWLFTRRAAGEGAAWAAAALAAASPVLLHFGQEIRSYGLVVLLASMSCAAWARLRDGDGRPWAWRLYVAATAALLWTHYMTAWLILAQNLAPPPDRKPWFGAQALVALSFAPWIPFAWAHVTRFTGDFWLPAPTVGSVVRSFQTLCFYTDDHTLPAWWLRWGMTAFWAAVVLWAAARKRALVVLLLVPPAAELLLSLKQPLYYTRTFLYVVIPLLALAGTATASAGRRRGALLLIGLLGTSAVGLAYQWALVEKEDWRGAAALIERERKPDDLVIVYPGYGGHAMTPYDGGRHGAAESGPVTVARPPVDPDFGSVLRAPRVWLVLRHGKGDPAGIIEKVLERRGYSRESSASLHEVVVHRYGMGAGVRP